MIQRVKHEIAGTYQAQRVQQNVVGRDVVSRDCNLGRIKTYYRIKSNCAKQPIAARMILHHLACLTA